ncbi:MAG: hypothetical protein PVG25_08070 [Anaerolineae bacterium]|jgi:hypothetical protein
MADRVTSRNGEWKESLPEAMPGATIASFILRFMREPRLASNERGPSEPYSGAWRGVIRHVQTTEEIHFAEMEEALSFIARYVDVAEDLDRHQGSTRSPRSTQSPNQEGGCRDRQVHG